MNHSTPGLPIHHQLPEFTQTHVHWVNDAIQPSHLLSPSPPAFSLSQHQGLFQWVNSLQCMTSQIYYSSSAGGASLKAQTVKNLPARQETWGNVTILQRRFSICFCQASKDFSNQELPLINFKNWNSLGHTEGLDCLCFTFVSRV